MKGKIEKITKACKSKITLSIIKFEVKIPTNVDNNTKKQNKR